MTTLQLSVSDAKFRRLKERADEYGLSVEELLDRVTDEVANRPSAEFDDIANRVLAKNRELYQRLTK